MYLDGHLINTEFFYLLFEHDIAFIYCYAFVAGRHGDTVRVSARCSREAARRGLNLAKLLGEVGKSHGGDGGGHRSAAALEAAGEPSAILDACRKKAAESLP